MKDKINPMDSGLILTLERKIAGGNSGGEEPDKFLKQLKESFLVFEYR